VIEEVVELTQPILKRGVRITVDVPPTVPMIEGDSGRIMQVLHNLLGNASKFTAEGIIAVSVDVFVEELTDANESMSEEDRTMVAVLISDTGIGIPKESLDTIFKPFEQVDMSTTRKYGGTGLGLALVKQLVEAHHGKVSVDSVMNKGTTFTCTFPMVQVKYTIYIYYTHTIHFTLFTVLFLSLCTIQPDKDERTKGRLAESRESTPEPLSPRPLARTVASSSANSSDSADEVAKRSIGDPEAQQRSLRRSNTAPMDKMKSWAQPKRTGSILAQNVQQQRATQRSHDLGVLSGGQKNKERNNTGPPPRADPAGAGPANPMPVGHDTMNTAAHNIMTPGSSSMRRLPSHFELTGKIEVLSVDDDPVNQMVVENLLQPHGYVVIAAMDGFEALEILKSRDFLPDLILLDVMMPRMSGYEACTKCRALFPSAPLPIIMVSAKTQEENIVQGLNAGCNDYLTKPFRRQEILARIETQLKLKEMWRLEVKAARSNTLLQEMLPRSIIERLEGGQRMIADAHANVTILFSDIVGFTTIAAMLSTAEVIIMLNEMFTAFDSKIDETGVYKVETIGDAYMVVAGHEELSEQDHAQRVMAFAKSMIDRVRSMRLPNGRTGIEIRVGIHTGTAYAGVIGTKCPRYCFFGDTVNTASRMESNGFPMTIHCSSPCHDEFTKAAPQVHDDLAGTTVTTVSEVEEFISLGDRQIKGKGLMSTYLVEFGDVENALALLKEENAKVEKEALEQAQVAERALQTQIEASRGPVSSAAHQADAEHAKAMAAAAKAEAKEAKMAAATAKTAEVAAKEGCAKAQAESAKANTQWREVQKEHERSQADTAAAKANASMLEASLAREREERGKLADELAKTKLVTATAASSSSGGNSAFGDADVVSANHASGLKNGAASLGELSAASAVAVAAELQRRLQPALVRHVTAGLAANLSAPGGLLGSLSEQVGELSALMSADGMSSANGGEYDDFDGEYDGGAGVNGSGSLRQQGGKLRRHQQQSAGNQPFSPPKTGQFGSPSKHKHDASWRVDMGNVTAERLEGDAQLCMFLRSIDLEHYAATLQREEVNMDVMGNLGEDELKELGIVTVGARRRMLDAIRRHNHAAGPR
jgi:CheY-like chemotaxis protein